MRFECLKVAIRTVLSENTSILVDIILEQFRKISFSSSQYAWRRSKSAPIGTVASGMRSNCIGNDFHVSHVEIVLIVLEIWLVVNSS
jgi:hypothetical protein